MLRSALLRSTRLFSSCASPLRSAVLTNARAAPVLAQNRSFSNVATARKPLSTEYEHEHDDTIASGDPSRRAYTYLVLGSARFVYASFARLAVLKLIATMNASADVLALASVEVDITGISEGSMLTIKWRGKPVFIKHRTAQEIQEAANVDLSTLRHVEKDEERYVKPNYLIVLGVCTHLGCVPLGNAGDFAGGWFCPCHGSHYDTSARIRKGPAPLNLEVPPYKFIEDDTKVLIG